MTGRDEIPKGTKSLRFNYIVFAILAIVGVISFLLWSHM